MNPSSYTRLKSEGDDGDDDSPGGGVDSSSIDTDSSSLSDSSTYLKGPPSLERGGFFPTPENRTKARPIDMPASGGYFSTPSNSSSDDASSTASHAGDQVNARSGLHVPLGLETVFETSGFVTDDGESTAAGTTAANTFTSALTDSPSEYESKKEKLSFIHVQVPGSDPTSFGPLSPSAFSDFDEKSPASTPASCEVTSNFADATPTSGGSTVATPDSAIALLIQDDIVLTANDQINNGDVEQEGQYANSTPSRDASMEISPNTSTSTGTSPKGCDSSASSIPPPSLLFGRFDINIPNHCAPVFRRTSSSFTCIYLPADDHRFSPAPRVTLKLMEKSKHVLTELNCRTGINDESYILACKGVFIDHKEEQIAYKGSIPVDIKENLESDLRDTVLSRIKQTSKSKDNIFIPSFPYCLVLEGYDSTLEDFTLHSYLNLSIIRSIVKDLVVGLILLQTEKWTHANINLGSIVRVGRQWKLADLHFATTTGNTIDLTAVNQFFMSPDAAASILRGENGSPRCLANASYDLFSLGCVLYHLTIGRSLWNTSTNYAMTRHDLLRLANWPSKFVLGHMSLSLEGVGENLLDEQFALFDLLSKLLSQSKEARSESFEFGFVSVHQHEFLAGKALGQESMRAFVRRKEASLQEEENAKQYHNILAQLSMEDQWEINRAKDVLLLGLFEPVDVPIPTSIVVLRRKLPAIKPNEMTRREIQKRLAEGIQWLDVFPNLTFSVDGALKGDISSIGHFWKEIAQIHKGCEYMYLYFVDDLSGEPVVPQHDENQMSYTYPIEIPVRSDVLPRIIPMMHLTIRSAALYHGVAGVARMFGSTMSNLPEEWRSLAQVKVNALKQERGATPFGSLAADIDMMRASREQFMKSSSLRAKAARELVRFVEKKEGHKVDFVGLQRYPDSDGFAIWTCIDNSAGFKDVISKRSAERLKEERNHWVDVQEREIDALVENIGVDTEKMAVIEKTLGQTVTELATSNSNANALQSQIAAMEKTLEEKEQVIEETKAELEREKNQAKCACAIM
mmetsp:Transcript_15491/g.44849  ORF Transcript_15491/g.44849 Transcript_15491/m.44849 type:complete len:1026 (-) Transcript_15491:1577-4654(-)